MNPELESQTQPRSRFARNFYWVGALAMLLAFNALLIGTARFVPSVASQFSIDGTRSDLAAGLRLALVTGNLGLGVVVFFSSLLAFFAFNLPCHARRFKIALLVGVGIIFQGALLNALWCHAPHPGVDPTLSPAFPIDVLSALCFGLPLLWSLTLAYIALNWHEGDA